MLSVTRVYVLCALLVLVVLTVVSLPLALGWWRL